MTIDEIFSQIIQHQIKGLMIHEQLADYYDFLCLKGYKRCHEYHFFEENIIFRKISRYYINHHNKLIPNSEVSNPSVIPSNWYKYKREEVDNSTKRTAIKNGFKIWVDWEYETKKLYESMYNELLNMNDVASSIMLKDIIKDVDCELKCAERKYLELKSIDYDMSVIIPEQEHLHDVYKKLMEDIILI